MAFLDLPGLTRFTTKIKNWVTDRIGEIHPVKTINNVSPDENGNADLSTVSVMLSAQTMTAAQKTQARNNIGAANATDVTAINTVSSTTPSLQTSKITDRGSKIFKMGKLVIVSISCDVTEEIDNSTIMYKIPEGYRPSETVRTMLMTGLNSSNNLATRSSVITINSSGEVKQNWSSSYSGWIAGIFVYAVS